MLLVPLHPMHYRLWWQSVDRWLLGALVLLAGFGVWLVFAASPAVALRINIEKYHFLFRHIAFLIPTLCAMLWLSFQNPRTIRTIAFIGFIVFFILTALTLFSGADIKGASRWLYLPGLSLQPSEFLKPFFALITAWLFAQQQETPRFPARACTLVLIVLCCGLLASQPDMGMTIVLAASWAGQCLLAGLPWIWVGALAALGALGLLGAYTIMPHFASRIDRFFHPEGADLYQIERAMAAYANGGVMGVGPGQGTAKMHIPDSHTDFIFAVAGEELGLITCSLIVLLFAFIVLRGFQRAGLQKDLFALIGVGGLMMQFGMQALINLASSLHLIPTKGMTLPFVSYGGSSLLALGVSMGMMLALTRHSSPHISRSQPTLRVYR